MSLFDKNVWYNIRFNASDGNALKSSGNYFFATGGPYGSAYTSPYNDSEPDASFNWQFFPSPQNSSQFILRPANAKPNVWLASLQQSIFGNCGDECSSTGVGVTNVTGLNAVWTVQPSGDGISSYLSNEDNGTNWRLALDTSGKAPGSYLNMGEAGAGNIGQMHWQFRSAAKINDRSFSTVSSGFTASQPHNASHPSSNSSSPSPPTSSPSSTNVGAAVGGAIGGLAAIILIVTLGLFFWRRRRKAVSNEHEPLPLYDGLSGTGATVDRKEEMLGVEEQRNQDVAEAPSDNQILEAPRDQETGMGAEPINKGDVSELPAEDYRDPPGRVMR
ncbi:MAG: hypothetical protein Q9159_001074 [Coniocarpon cinnabarinum]